MFSKSTYKQRAAKESGYEITRLSTHNIYARYGGSEKAKWWFKRPAYSVPGKKEEE